MGARVHPAVRARARRLRQAKCGRRSGGPSTGTPTSSGRITRSPCDHPGAPGRPGATGAHPEPVPLRVGWLVLASVGLWSGFFGPIQVLLAQQSEALSLDHKGSRAGPRHRGGRLVSTVPTRCGAPSPTGPPCGSGRRPWVLGGAVTGRSRCCCSAAGLGLAARALVGARPGRAQRDARGRDRDGARPGAGPGAGSRGRRPGSSPRPPASSSGSGIAAATGSIAAGYLTIAVVLVATTVPYAVDSRDIPLPREWRPAFRWRGVPARLLGLALMSTRTSAGVAHPVPHEPGERPAHPLPALLPQGCRGPGPWTAAPRMPCSASPWSTVWVTVVTALVGGAWSDRAGRRKVFVIWSGLIAASALMIFAFVPTSRRPTSERWCSASASAPTPRWTSR